MLPKRRMRSSFSICCNWPIHGDAAAGQARPAWRLPTPQMKPHGPRREEAHRFRPAQHREAARLLEVEASLARNLLCDSPTEAVIPTFSVIRAMRRASVMAGLMHSASRQPRSYDAATGIRSIDPRIAAYHSRNADVNPSVDSGYARPVVGLRFSRSGAVSIGEVALVGRSDSDGSRGHPGAAQRDVHG